VARAKKVLPFLCFDPRAKASVLIAAETLRQQGARDEGKVLETSEAKGGPRKLKGQYSGEETLLCASALQACTSSSPRVGEEE